MTEIPSNVIHIHPEIPGQSRFSNRITGASEGIGYRVGVDVRTLAEKFQQGELLPKQPLPPNIVMFYKEKNSSP